MNNYIKSLLAITAIATLSACSGSGNCPPNSDTANGDASVLQVVTPKNIYSVNLHDSVGYVVVKNPSATTVKNLHYGLNNQIGSGNSVTIDSVRAAECATVAANSSCNVKLNIPAGAVAGSFGFTFDNTTTESSKSNQFSINSAMQIGIEQASYNTISGADGITINYYHTIIAGIPYVLVNGIVASSNAGNFNNIVLVDAHDTAIPNQQLISGAISSNQGSTFSILLPAPTGVNSTQTIKVQTQLLVTNGTKMTEPNISTSSTLHTTSDIGIADMLPGKIYLTANNPEQIITFANTGNNIAQLQNLVASESNIEVTFTPKELTSGAIATAKLRLKNQAVAAQIGSLILNYNDGKTDTSALGQVEQNKVPNPEPTPTPSPSPTVSPSPVPPLPTAGLTAELTPDSDFFTTTATGTVSRQLTITNSGNTTENNFVLTLPANFTISAGNSNSCNVTHGSSPATIDNSLATTGSCTITVTYANNAVVYPAATANISIAYYYNNGIMPAPTPAQATISYRVTQSTANLSLTPSAAQNYGSIVSDNSAVSSIISYTVTNSGDASASNLAFNFTGTDSSLFHEVTGGSCLVGGSLSNVSGSNSCTINTQFGPAPNGSAGSKTATFNVGYTPYSGGATTNTADITLSGTVTAAPTASFTVAYSSIAFTSGTGTQTDQYQGYTNNSYIVTVTYTNNSAIPATNFTTSSFASSDGFSKTTAASGSACNNVLLAANGGTCSDTYTLNSTDPGNHSLNLANVTTSWTDSSGTYTGQAVADAPTVYANLIAQTVAVNVTSITPSGFVLNTTADGKTQSKPLALHYNTNNESIATLSITYQNSGTIDATSFTSSITTLPTGWSLTTQGCSGVSLNAGNGNSCTDVYSFTSKPSAGVVALTKPDGVNYTTNFNINDVKLSWNSAIGNLTNQTPASIIANSNTSGIVYANYFLQIFISNTTHNGNFATDSTNIGTGFVSGQPITNADTLCANDSNKPNDGYTYKALLSYGNDTAAAVQGTNRFACGGTPSSPSCGGTNVTAGVDWVLRPGYVQYRSFNNENKTIVANTLESYGVTSTTARPGNYGITADVWTGLSNTTNYQWTSELNHNCAGWSDGTASYYGRKGTAGTTANYYTPIYSSADLFCNSTYALYCVQQVN